MTEAELRAQFAFLRQVATGPVATHYARDPSGKFVMVHLLVGVADPERAELLRALRRLRVTDQARVLMQLEVDGAPVDPKIIVDP